MKRYHDLDIDLNERQRDAEWTIQRITWPLLTLLLLLTGLGLFGRGGPLSSAQAGSQDGAFRIEYERFVRRHSPSTLRIDVRADSENEEVLIDSEYLKYMSIEQITPEPERVVAEEGAMRFVFNTQAGAGIRLAFEYHPDKLGPIHGWIGPSSQNPVAIKQFAYP